MHVSSSDRAFFGEHGWLIVRRAVAASRVAELEAALDEVRSGFPEAAPDTVWEAAGISRFHPALAEHARDARIGALVAALLGCDAVRLLQDTALVKPARVGGAVPWHRDHTYTSYLEPASLVSVRLALTPCTRASGCLEVIDASHVHAPAQARAVALELRPGDISLHHCLTLHRSGTNTAAHARKTLVTRLFDSSASVDVERLPQAARQALPDFPLVYPSGTKR